MDKDAWMWTWSFMGLHHRDDLVFDDKEEAEKHIEELMRNPERSGFVLQHMILVCRERPEKEEEQLREALYLNKTTGPCFVCQEPTHLMEINYQCRICSEKCLVEMDRKFADAYNGITDSEEEEPVGSLDWSDVIDDLGQEPDKEDYEAECRQAEYESQCRDEAEAQAQAEADADAEAEYYYNNYQGEQ